MCKFYSAIVLKNGDLLHDVHLTSHEDIIDLYGLNDNTTENLSHIVGDERKSFRCIDVVCCKEDKESHQNEFSHDFL